MTTPVISKGAIALRQCGANGTQIAIRVGAAYPTVNNWMKGHRLPGPEMRAMLLRFYGIAVSWWDESAAGTGANLAGGGGLLDAIGAAHEVGAPLPRASIAIGAPRGLEVGTYGRESVPPVEAGPVDPRSEAEALAAHVRRFRWQVETDTMLTANEKAKTLELASRAVERLYRLTGEAANIPAARILAAPAWGKIREAVVGALEAHPEALRAVVAALEELQ